MQDSPTKQFRNDSWVEDVLKSKSKPISSAFSNLLEMERFGNSSVESSMVTDLNVGAGDDIPVIPDADEVQENMLFNESTNLPSTTTYKQLGTEIFQSGKSNLGHLDDIDLSILTECLENEATLEEPDDVWQWDQIFAQISVKISDETKNSTSEITK